MWLFLSLQPETPALPRSLLSDILSVLAITVEDKERLCLKRRLTGTGERISSFGHPYIRSLSPLTSIQLHLNP